MPSSSARRRTAMRKYSSVEMRRVDVELRAYCTKRHATSFSQESEEVSRSTIRGATHAPGWSRSDASAFVRSAHDDVEARSSIFSSHVSPETHALAELVPASSWV